MDSRNSWWFHVLNYSLVIMKMDVFTDAHIHKTYKSTNKWHMIGLILNLYCSETHLSRNLWLLSQITDTLEEIEDNAHRSQAIVESICKLVAFIKKTPKKDFHITPKNTNFLLYHVENISPAIGFMKDFVSEDAYKYYSILYENIKNNEDEITCLQITNTLLSLSQKSKEMDQFDCMFFFMLKLLEILQLDPKMCKYINFCKDLFYYRYKKKDKMLRVNLVYYSIHVLVTKKVSYKPLMTTNSHEYLFRPIEIDYRKIHEVQTLKAACQKDVSSKHIAVDTCDFRDPNVEVIRK